jgi:hypothetical protein
MQIHLFEEYIDFSDKTVCIGLSSGINSAALLCWLAKYPEERKPKTLLLYAAHFVNHSPRSLEFLTDCITYAVRNFRNIKIKVTWNDVLEFFRAQHTIPHPSLSPCSRMLKYQPSEKWAFGENDCDIDLVGFVREELKRRTNKQPKGSINKLYPIGHISNEECFAIVDSEIGWHPPIYDFRCGTDGLCKKCKKRQKRTGFVQLGCKKRIFEHNNCIPCKNGEDEDYENWNDFYPEYMRQAYQLSTDLTVLLGETVSWGRDKAVNMCHSCTFD